VVGAVAALLVTRELRGAEDAVSSVRITHVLVPGAEGRSGAAKIRFALAEPDRRADVLVIDPDERVAATLAAAAELAAGRHKYRWDGRTDAGGRAPSGPYRVRIVLREQGREVVPPGYIRVKPPDPG
jgi:flagellar hook assembly protein FlgD